MENIATQIQTRKQHLEQKKARLIVEETNFKIKERQMRIKHLMAMGGLVAKANMDYLPSNTLYGALLSLKELLDNDATVENSWQEKGKLVLNQESAIKLPIILKLAAKPNQQTSSHIRNHGLKWNQLRQEWYGYVTDINSLQEGLQNIEYDLEIIKD